ncbi:hypothetical protein [Streptococcus jiangjianxini]|uniref:hypothetical protein n=1 Tax=Streptococcus jiangjianxini TaxID=3161189 RepID=UPI0032EF9881
MTYITTKNIRDTQDNDYLYLEGYQYPRKGFSPSEGRITELLEKGAIISTLSEAEETVEETSKESQVDTDLTIPEIKVKLDELGIKYNSKTNKAELLELLEGTEEE